jgi:hypothetical protein
VPAGPLSSNKSRARAGRQLGVPCKKQKFKIQNQQKSSRFELFDNGHAASSINGMAMVDSQ